MAVAKVFTAQPDILSGQVVVAEADLTRGLHSFSIVGLAGKAIEEAKDRINSAIKNTGYKPPKSLNNKIVISLSPADLKKEGPLYDVPIALAYLIAAEEIKFTNDKIAFVGELSLDGNLRPVRGVLPIVQGLKKAGFTEVIVPAENAAEAALIIDITIRPANTLAEIIKQIDEKQEQQISLPIQPETKLTDHWHEGSLMLEDIKGQETAKRGLLIAAAGRHNVIMVGPPGTGKTMLARAFQSLLPPLSREEVLSVLSVHSIAGILPDKLLTAPPFRTPHHSASHTSIVGGGANPRPGEITLAHNGVLFMDELPEFERRSIDALRQPLEDKVVTISRVQGTAVFPADFVLIAAMNPYRGVENGSTDYAAAMLETYKEKISGPILDRIDLWLPVPHIDYDTLTNKTKNNRETSDARNQIIVARKRMGERLKKYQKTTNANMSAREIEETISLSGEVSDLLKISSVKLNLSPRAHHRVIKVARTIADLADAEEITTEHLLEALQYRVKI